MLHQSAYTCKQGSVTAVQYQDEIVDPIVKLYAKAVDLSFVLTDDNAIIQLSGRLCAWSGQLAHQTLFLPIEDLWNALGSAVCRCLSGHSQGFINCPTGEILITGVSSG